MDVSETLLPGVGIRYEFQTRDGRHVGIIVHREGNAQFIEYDRDDPDVGRTLLTLEADEAAVVADILGAPRFASKLADLTREIPGLLSEPIRLPATSSFVGRRLGETHCRTVTGASIVAVVRGDEVISSPAPDQLLLAGDTLVTIGTASGIRRVKTLFEIDA